MSQCVSHAQDGICRSLYQLRKFDDVGRYGCDRQRTGTRSQLVQQMLTAVDSRHGKPTLRQGQRVQADACSQVERGPMWSDGQTNRVQLGCAAHQSCLDVADHPRINAAEVTVVM